MPVAANWSMDLISSSAGDWWLAYARSQALRWLAGSCERDQDYLIREYCEKEMSATKYWDQSLEGFCLSQYLFFIMSLNSSVSSRSVSAWFLPLLLSSECMMRIASRSIFHHEIFVNIFIIFSITIPHLYLWYMHASYTINRLSVFHMWYCKWVWKVITIF